MINLTFNKNDFYIIEGDFRVAHIRLRTNAESIAFLTGERQERLSLEHRLGLCISNSKALMWSQVAVFSVVYAVFSIGLTLAWIVSTIQMLVFPSIFNYLNISSLRFIFDPYAGSLSESDVSSMLTCSFLLTPFSDISKTYTPRWTINVPIF